MKTKKFFGRFKDTLRDISYLLKHVDNKKTFFVSVIFFGLLAGITTMLFSYFLGYTIDVLMTYVLPSSNKFEFPTTNLIVFLALSVLSCTGGAVFSVFLGWFVNKYTQKLVANLRLGAYTRLQQMPVSYFDTHSSGDLMSRMVNDIGNISLMTSQTLYRIVITIFSAAISVIFMFLTAPILATIVVLTVPILFSFLTIITKLANPHFIEQQKRLGKLNGFVEEYIAGQKITWLFGQSKKVVEMFRVNNESLTKSSLRSQTISNLAFPYANFVNSIAYVLFYIVGIVFSVNKVSTYGVLPYYGHGVNSEFSVGVLAGFFGYTAQFAQPFTIITTFTSIIQAGTAGMRRVFEIIDLKPEKENVNVQPVEQIFGKVEFRNLSFGYLPNKLILKNINFVAEKGDTIAIVGPTGAGKTTIASLLSKFYNPTSGKILIDDIDITLIKRDSLNRHVSVVLQDTFLFSASIKENIRYGNLQASDQEIVEACKKANCHNFIMQLKDGYDTLISNNGDNFSVGQRQSLAIARAMIANSNVLILDEATSSIDTLTEQNIQRAMLKLMEGKTSFVIAHRMSTIKNAKKILVIDDGQIVESGNHYELLKLNGFYANMYHSQFKRGVFDDE